MGRLMTSNNLLAMLVMGHTSMTYLCFKAVREAWNRDHLKKDSENHLYWYHPLMAVFIFQEEIAYI
jgi:hypothetical protein